MSTQTITCPHCQSLLRSDRPLPIGANLRCPDCKTSFIAPTVDLPPSPARTSLLGAPFLIAITVSLLLGGAIIAAAIILSGPRTPRTEPAGQSALAEEERKQLDKKHQDLLRTKAQLDLESRKLKHGRLMAQAELALGKGQYTEAEKHFQEALEVMPGDKDAIAGLVSAKTALVTAKRTSEIDTKNQVEITRLLDESKKAMAAKQYSAAVQLLTAAQKIAPANRTVIDALLEAQKACDADTGEKTRLADYKKHMDAGKAALGAERYADAVKEYLAALQLMPDDLEATQGRKLAENKIADLADNDKRKKAFQDLLADARKSKDNKRFNEAIASLKAALRINKNDPEATRLLTAVEQALKSAKADNAKLLTQADAALKLGQLAVAKRFLEDALKNWPEDERAEKGLKDIDRVMTTTVNAQAAYQQFVLAGATAMLAGRYADAVAAYTSALQLVPTDLDTQVALKKAQVALAVEVKAALAYNNAITAGTNALNKKLWTTAVNAFKAALKLIPNDPVASNGLNQALYGGYMASGWQALTNKQRASAIKAYNNSLNIVPGDPTATRYLNQAKTLR